MDACIIGNGYVYTSILCVGDQAGMVLVTLLHPS